MTEETTWCDLCGYHVTKDDVEDKCHYWDCPKAAPRVVDTGDELHQILGAALRLHT